MRFPIEEDFERIMGIPFCRVRDDFLTVVLMKPVIDILLLDRELHGQYGFYEEQGLSMNDVLYAHFSPEDIMILHSMIIPPENE